MRPRNDVQPEPEAQRELAAVDAALAGRPLPHDLQDIGDLVLALRAERPLPQAAAAAQLDARARDGFRAPVADADQSGDDARRRVLPLPWLRRPAGGSLPLALGTAACLLIGLTAVLSSGVLSGDGAAPVRTLSEPAESPSGQGAAKEPAAAGSEAPSDGQAREPSRAAGGGSEATGGPEPGGDAAADLAAPAPSTIAPSPPPIGGGGIAPRVRQRKVERQGSLTLAADNGEVEQVADQVIRTTDRYGGLVISSTVSGGSDGGAGATLDLRLPAHRAQQAIADLSKLAHVRSRSQSSQDVTASYLSVTARLRELRAERRSLLRRLAAAVTPEEAARVRSQLRLVNRRAAAARSDLRARRNRIDYATVSVTVVEDGKAASDDGWTPADGVADARDILGASLAALIVAAAVLLPAGLILLAAFALARRVARERRERALDGSDELEGRGPA